MLGANGAGKTTTLRAMCGIMVRAAKSGLPASGSRQGDRRHRPPRRRPCARRSRHVPQLTAEENLRLGAYTAARPGGCSGFRPHLRLFPRLKERRGSRPARCPAASSRCWRSPAR